MRLVRRRVVIDSRLTFAAENETVRARVRAFAPPYGLAELRVAVGDEDERVRSDAGGSSARPRREVSAELLGLSDDDALRATQEAEPVDVLVLRDLADEFGTVAAQADNDVVDRRQR